MPQAAPRKRRTFTLLLLVVSVAATTFFLGFLSGIEFLAPESGLRTLAVDFGWIEEKPAEVVEYTAAGRRQAEAREEAEARREATASLPYAERSYDPDSNLRGVILHDEALSQPGLNFYSSVDLPAAFLVDMDGRPVYQWRGRGGPWQHVTLLPNGHVVGIVFHEEVFEVDENSEVVWRHEMPAHHDLWIAEDGRRYVITGKVEVIPDFHPELEIFNDYITVFSPEGEWLEEFSVYELVANSDFAFLLPRVDRLAPRYESLQFEAAADIFHTNHVEGFDSSIRHEFPWFREGFLLLSISHLNAVAVADLEQRKLVWMWGPPHLVQQHHPTVLDSGNLLIFNNGLRRSEVIELDPATRELVWSYRDEEFFTVSRGSNFRLANGNTLITESDSGYAFEVTPEGEKVWVFANPSVEGDERAAIWRMVRVDPEELPFLDEVTLRTE